MSMPFNPGTGADALAVINRATLPRDIDEAVLSHTALTEEVERFGDRAKVAYGLAHARDFNVQAIDSADRPVGDPCTSVDDIVNTWRTHRDSGVAIPMGHHAGQTVIGVRADSFEAWSAWLADSAGFTRSFTQDGMTYGEHRGLREIGRYSVITRVPQNKPVSIRSVAFMGDRGLREASEAFGVGESPRKPRGFVTALWVLSHRSSVSPAGVSIERPEVRGRKLADGVRLMGNGELVAMASAVGADTRIVGDIPPQTEGSTTGFDVLSGVLAITWK